MESSAGMNQHRTSIAQVAVRAGVSKTTVSHVINNTRLVSEPTKQRVLKAIADLDYRPSAAARSLTTKKSGVVGVIISDARNHFFGELLRGIEDGFGTAGYGLMVCDTDELLDRERVYLDLLLRQHVDGIIMAAASRDSAALNTARSYNLPVVFVDRRFRNIPGPLVGVDNEAGAYLGTSHLIEAGHRDIGLIAGFSRLSTMRERASGVRRALREFGLAARSKWIVSSPLSVEAGRAAVRRALSMSPRPTALFINNNLLTLGGLLALRDLRLRCPDDVGLVGFDDHPWASVSAPPLTVVAQPVHELGLAAARTLFEIMSGRDIGQDVTLPCKLIVRESCCPQHKKNGRL